MNEEEISKFLEHHGIKGQKWGIRKKDDIGGNDSASPVQKALKENKGPPLTKEQKALVAETQKKHDAKSEVSEDDNAPGWRPTKKQVALVAAGALFAAVVIYKVKTGKSPSTAAFSVDDYLKVARSADTPGWVAGFAGTHMSPTDYKGLVENSAGRVWTGQHVTAESFRQKAFSLPKGHEFFRISQRAENSFKDTTYAVSSTEDFARYLHTFKGAANSGAQKISFKATSTVKVPDMHTQLEAMRQVLSTEVGAKVTPEHVLENYAHMTGGGFTGPKSVKFLSVLRKQGFHAIIDEMDAGVYGESPLVLIDKTVFGKKTSTSLASLGADYLKAQLVDIKNRR